MAQRCGVRLRLENSSVHNVHADPDRLMQVAANLLSTRYILPPGAEWVAAETAGTFCISRQGSRPAFRKISEFAIFRKFAQADTSDARQEDRPPGLA